jgi:chromosome segregation ATPase
LFAPDSRLISDWSTQEASIDSLRVSVVSKAEEARIANEKLSNLQHEYELVLEELRAKDSAIARLAQQLQSVRKAESHHEVDPVRACIHLASLPACVSLACRETSFTA